MPDVRLPDGTIVKNVPEGTTKAQLMEKLAASGRDVSAFGESVTPDPVRPKPGFLDRLPHTAGVVGAAENMAAVGAGAFDFFNPIRGLAGIGAAVIPGGKTGPEMIESLSIAPHLAPRTERGQQIGGAISRAVEPIAEFGRDTIERGVEDQFGSPKSILDVPGSLIGKIVGKPAIAAATETALAAPGVAVAPRVAASSVTRPRPAPPPAVAELFEKSRSAFQKADEANVVVKSDSVFRLVDNIVDKTKGIDKDIHPDSSAALRRILDDSNRGSLTFDEVSILRQIAADAKGSAKPSDARFGSIIVDEIDNFVQKLGSRDVSGGNALQASQSIKEARELWSRARKGETIERLIDKAGLSAQGFSGSGFENALRTQFRALAKNDKKIRLFTKAEQAAIRRVALGGPIDNALRMLGKFAPTGVVSTALSTGLGAGLGGPIGAAALPILGLLSRQGATKATIANANKASELVRSGGT